MRRKKISRFNFSLFRKERTIPRIYRFAQVPFVAKFLEQYREKGSRVERNVCELLVIESETEI